MILFHVMTLMFLPAAMGLALISLFLKNFHCHLFLRLGMACGLGLGVITQWMLLIGSLGLPMDARFINIPLWAVTLLLAGILFVRENENRNFCDVLRQPVEPLNFFEWIFCGIIGFYVCVVFLNALRLVPVIAWDGIATLAFKGKFFFYEQTFAFNHLLPHPSYPLHLPFLMSWTAVTIGEWHEYFVKFFFPFYFCSLLLICYGFLREYIPRTAALFGIVLLCFGNYLVLHAFLAYRDLPLAFYNCLTVFLIILWKVRGSEKLLILAGLFSGLAAFVKLEGYGYAVVHGILIVCLGLMPFRSGRKDLRQTARDILVFLIPVGILILSYALFKIHFRIPFGEPGKTELIFASDIFQRIPVIIGSFFKNMFWSTYWGWNWYLLTICVLLSLRSFSEIARGILTAMILFFASCAALFLLTPNYHYCPN